jgi:hypothetical protein
MTAPRLETILRALSVFFAALAVTVFLWPVSVPRNQIAPAGLEAPSSQPARASDPSITQSIVTANIFSAGRKPPSSRYNPFEPDPIAPEPSLGASMMVDTGVVSNEDTVPGLFGIMSSPAGSTALMRLDAAVPEAVLYREGDRAGQYRVIKINSQSVVLSGPRGQTVLQLKRPEGP